jgi:hypothetical protein
LTSSAIAIHVSAWKPNGAKGVRKAEPQRRRLDKKEPKERECSIGTSLVAFVLTRPVSG